MTIKHWEKLHLREAASKVGSGATPMGGRESYHTTGIPLIRSQNVRFEGFTEDGLAYLDANQAASLDNAVVRRNDVLLNITGASIGRVTLAPAHMDGARVNQHVTIIRLRDGIDPSFVRWFIASPSQQRQINSIQVGVTRQALTKDIILRFELPLPPLNEQRRIVEKIEELFSDLDAGVAALKRAKANLKRYRAAVLKSAVEGKLTEEWRAKHPHAEPASKLLARILTERRQKWESDQLAKFASNGKQPPKGWKEKYVEPARPDATRLPDFPPPEVWTWTTLDAIAYVTKLAGFEYTKFVKYDPDGDLAVIKAENAGKHGFRRTEYSRVRFESVKLLARSVLRGGELLMVFVGVGVGQVAIVPNDQPYFLGPNIGMIRISVPYVRSHFCELFLRSSHGYKLSTSFVKAVAQPSLSMGTIRQIPILLPPPKEQEQILSEVAERLSQIDAAETAIEHGLLRAARLRQSILKQAFEGKLVPQDPNDEPANELLTRLNDRQLSQIANGNENIATSSRRRKSASTKKNNDEVDT